MASPEAYHAKLDAVREQIQNLNLTFDQKKAFLDELSSKPWEADWSKAFTNDYLQGDRCAEGLFHLAKGLEASGNQTLIPDLNYDTLKSIAGTTVHSSKERVFGIGLELTDKVGQEVAGSGSTWWIPITGFANTFKDMKVEESDATVQEPENDRDNVEA